MEGLLGMNKKNISDAYFIDYNLAHLKDQDGDGEIDEFPGYEDIMFERTDQIKLPEIPTCLADLKTLKKTDFPCCTPLWPVMSKKMINTLLKIKQFPHKIFPILMVDQLTNQINEDYVIVHLLDHLDIIDHDKSIIKTSNDLKWYITEIDKLRLKNVNNLPPLFRLYQHPIELLVSSDARSALINEGINGIKYISLDNYSYP